MSRHSILLATTICAAFAFAAPTDLALAHGGGGGFGGGGFGGGAGHSFGGALRSVGSPTLSRPAYSSSPAIPPGAFRRPVGPGANVKKPTVPSRAFMAVIPPVPNGATSPNPPPNSPIGPAPTVLKPVGPGAKVNKGVPDPAVPYRHR
jgi:hypothetical protein